jgi:hypothetical protein
VGLRLGRDVGVGVDDRHGQAGDAGPLDVDDGAGDLGEELLSARDRGQKDQGKRQDELR